MRSFLYLLCFLLILPPMAAAGHDFYRAYNENRQQLPLAEPFEQSDLGWLMVHYTPTLYNVAVDSIDKETWKTHIYPLLLKKAWIVLSIPAAFVCGLVLLLRLFGIWPFNGMGLLVKGRVHDNYSSTYDFDSDRPKKRTKYSRK